jgi:hypothetical protein
MFNPFKAPTRSIPRLRELEGYLVQFEAFGFDTVRAPHSWDIERMERMNCAVTVLAPPRGQTHMAVTVDGHDHVLPVTFGTREAPMYVTSLNVLTLCRNGQTRGRLYLCGDHSLRRWWTLTPEPERLVYAHEAHCNVIHAPHLLDCPPHCDDELHVSGKPCPSCGSIIVDTSKRAC